MAIVKYGAIIVDAKGSVGGTTFKGTKAGAVMQNKVTMAPVPDGKVTKADAGRAIQGFQKIAIANVVNAWKALDLPNKEEWNAFAPSYPFKNKFGEDYVASGYQCFCNLNLNLSAINQPFITAPPVLDPLEPMPDYQMWIKDTPSIDIKITVDVPTGYVFTLSLATMRSPGRMPTPKDFSQVAVLTAGSYDKAPIIWPIPSGMNKAELIDAIASNAKLTKADAGRVVKGEPKYPTLVTVP